MSPNRAPTEPQASQNRTKSEPRPNHIRRRREFLSKRLTPRVRDLFRDLIANKTDAGAYLESQCLKVAELTVAAEGLRAKLDAMLSAADADVRSLAALINSVTRLESTARRAAADLGKVAPADDPADDWIALQEEADRLTEERRNEANR